MIDPKDLPRVPHATEDGLQEGRPHPALRRYQADYKVVDWAEGLKLLANRRAGKEPRIKGGVDDGSEEMKLKGAVLPDPYSKTKINPKEPVGKEASDHVPTREEVMSMKPGAVEELANRTSKFDPFIPAKEDQEIPDDAVMPDSAPPPRQKPKGRPRRVQPVAAPPPPAVRDDESAAEMARLKSLVASYEERIESLSKELERYSEFSSKRERVEIHAQGFSFSVAAVDVVESMYGIVVFLPLGGDSMTFTPSPMSRVTISCQSRRLTEEVAYTGINFEIPLLNLFGLAFIKRPPVHDDKPAEPVEMDAPKGSLSSLVSLLADGKKPDFA